MRMTDTAGNTGNWTSQSLERDTTAPLAPSLEASKSGDILAEYLTVGISGEAYTEARIEVIYNDKKITIEKTLNSYGLFETQNLMNKLQCGNVKYLVRAQLVDRAGNASDWSGQKEIETDMCPIFQKGGDGEGNSDNPWDDKNGSDLPSVKMDVNLKYGSDYNISNISIPAPRLTYIYTRFEGRIDLYGYGIPKNHPLKANIKIQYLTRNEAYDYCDMNKTFPNWFDFEKLRCIEKAMNIDNLYLWEEGVKLRCLIVNVFCINDKFQNERRYEDKDMKNLKTSHVQVNFYNHSQNEKFVTNLWNDLPNGRFEKDFKLNEHFKLGEKVRARISIFGSFEIDGMKISYSGSSKEDAKLNRGLSSEFSNSLTIQKSEFSKNIGGVEAYVLDVPYFNQHLEPDGLTLFPKDGWQMCGAASAVMIAGYYKKLEYNTGWDLKKYMYSDSGQGITGSCGPDKGGAFWITQYLTCNVNYADGVRNYLKRNNIPTQRTDSVSLSLPDRGFEKIKNSIEQGKPVIMSIRRPIDHILVITGYTMDGRVVVNDPWRNNQDGKSGPSLNGQSAIYDLKKSGDWQLLYYIFME